ncbi:MAG: hypothetical protein ACXACD_01740 [Candidatus Thorarchaeota archaeon]|jgi:chromatin segregation and condensation protein Rec8/ScpA/Scc1 (kleisin family)
MSAEDSSPFWASPPYILLTDVLQLDKIKPWNVDVGKLVAGFIREMKRLGDIDFRISLLSLEFFLQSQLERMMNSLFL